MSHDDCSALTIIPCAISDVVLRHRRRCHPDSIIDDDETTSTPAGVGGPSSPDPKGNGGKRTRAEPRRPTKRNRRVSGRLLLKGTIPLNPTYVGVPWLFGYTSFRRDAASALAIGGVPVRPTKRSRDHWYTERPHSSRHAFYPRDGRDIEYAGSERERPP